MFLFIFFGLFFLVCLFLAIRGDGPTQRERVQFGLNYRDWLLENYPGRDPYEVAAERKLWLNRKSYIPTDRDVEELKHIQYFLIEK